MTSIRNTTAVALLVLSTACSGPVRPAEAQDTRGTQKVDPSTSLPLADDDLPDVIERVLPSVVGISTRRTVSVPNFSPFFSPFGLEPKNRPTPRVQQGQGSGVIVSVDGLVITNNHVVEGAEGITVRLDDDRTFTAKVVGTDDGSDLALVRIDDPPKGLVAAEFGDSDALRLGQTVLAIGNPFGLQSTVTKGIVSAKGRANVGIVDFEDFIQTDAAINPGNSGGALINQRGQLVGINTAIVSRSGGYQGIGFAIPSNMAQSVMKDLLNGGEVKRGFLGVNIQTLDEDLAASLGLENHIGVVVAQVQKGSPAEAAGLQPGDVITHLDEKTVHTALEVRNAVALHPPGHLLTAKILRNGKSMVLRITLAQRDSGTKAPLVAGGALDGASFGPLNAEARKRFDIPDAVRSGVAVVSVKPGSAAAFAGLQAGDVVMGVGRAAVNSTRELNAALKKASQQPRLALRIARGDSVFYIVVRNANTRR